MTVPAVRSFLVVLELRRRAKRTGLSVSVDRRLTLVVCLSILCLASSLVGCRNDQVSDADNVTGQAEPFEFGRLQALPDLESLVNQAKPGHWVSAHQRMTASTADFQGTIRTSVLDLSNRPIPTEMTSHVLTTSRPIALSLGEPKDIELMFYIPRRLGVEASTVTLEHRLLDRRNQIVETQGGSVSLMPEYRFFHVVLSQNPSRYAYLKTLPTNQLIHDRGITQWTTVVTPKIERYVPLPSDMLAWTSISAIFWDDLAPDQLDPDQRIALVDWLHFGGQLILSGPDAIDRLKGSFLEPFLPATASGSVALTGNDLLPLLKEFDLPPRTGRASNLWQLGDQDRILGMSLLLCPQARFVPRCGSLVVDRAVGRGRVVVTAFSLHERGFREWNGVDNFIHNALLLRPRRDFSEPVAFGQPTEPPLQFVDAPGHEEDPRMSSSVRFFARDWGQEQVPGQIGTEKAATELKLNDDQENEVVVSSMPPGQLTHPGQASDIWRRGPYVPAKQSGIAGWNDRSQVATEARRVLDAATGIEPPSLRFVATALLVYLIILVPVNALIFRAVRRIEWAWIAAPIIAVAAAVIVARAAQLDIGFARSRTELVVVELVAGHPRAHVTRFSSLYTSLSTQFEMEFESRVVRAQPWGDPAVGDRVLTTPPQSVSLESTGLTKLTGFDVASNSAGLMHTEELVDVAGALTWFHQEGNQGILENRTQLTIVDAVVVSPLATGEMGFALVERIEPGRRIELKLQLAMPEEARRETWSERPETRSHRREAQEWFVQLDADHNSRLSLRELTEHPDFTEQWLERMRRGRREWEDETSASPASIELNLEDWTKESRAWLRGRLHVGELLELWLERAIRERVGSQMAGLIELVPETAKVFPDPSQVRAVSMVVASLEPIRLPNPGVDLDLPAVSLDPALPVDLEASPTP